VVEFYLKLKLILRIITYLTYICWEIDNFVIKSDIFSRFFICKNILIKLSCYHDNYFRYFMFGKYNGFVSKARVSACMYFLVFMSKTSEFSLRSYIQITGPHLIYGTILLSFVLLFDVIYRRIKYSVRVIQWFYSSLFFSKLIGLAFRRYANGSTLFSSRLKSLILNPSMLVTFWNGTAFSACKLWSQAMRSARNRLIKYTMLLKYCTPE
jgi:hypothetical protein